MSFRPTVSDDSLWEGEMIGARAGGVKVLLLRTGGRVYAYEDRCAHLGMALSQGALRDGKLVCSAHLWEYDATSGCGLNPKGACLRAFPVKVEGGQIWVDVGERVAHV